MGRRAATERRWRWAAGALGFGLNLAALALLIATGRGFGLPNAAAPPDLTVDLVHLNPTSARAQPLAAQPAKRVAPAQPKRVSDEQKAPATPSNPELPSPPAPAPAPSQPAPSAAPPLPAPTAAPSSRWRVDPALTGTLHGVGGGVLGCGHDYRNLTQAQQAACDRTFADTRSEPAPSIDTLPAAKRAYYDAVIAKKEHDRDEAFRELARKQRERGLAGRRTSFDINVGYKCAFKFGAGAKAANKAAGAKLGFPPCPIHLPGADLPPP